MPKFYKSNYFSLLSLLGLQPPLDSGKLLLKSGGSDCYHYFTTVFEVCLRRLFANLLFKGVFVCVVALAVSGCRLWPLVRGEEDDPVSELAEYESEGEPIIKPGLTLRVGVTASGATAVKEELKEVNLNGEILMPLIGEVKCEGLTTMALEDKLKTSFKDYFIEPQVSVSFVYEPGSGMKSPWGSVLVTGAVVREGPVNMPSTRELTVTRAVMFAGGASPLADKSKVRVSRRNADGTLKKFNVDLKKIGKDGRSDLDITLKPGDVVWVPESWY